jgi:hypothetical protein
MMNVTADRGILPEAAFRVARSCQADLAIEMMATRCYTEVNHFVEGTGDSERPLREGHCGGK